jgi:transcriptional regulator with XRE-family HTH domain
MKTMEKLGIRVKEARMSQKMNQRDFAEKIGISQSMLSGIEKDREILSDRNKSLICLVFGIEETWLLTGQGPMFTPPKTPPEAVQGPDGRELAPDERQLLEIYDKLIAEARREVRDYANERLELQELRERTGAGEKAEQSG